MRLIQQVENLGRKMKWYDFSILKAAVFFCTLFLLTAFGGFRDFALGILWYWYLLITVALMVPLIQKMFQ